MKRLSGRSSWLAAGVLVLLGALAFSGSSGVAQDTALAVEMPSDVLTDVPFEVAIGSVPAGEPITVRSGGHEVFSGRSEVAGTFAFETSLSDFGAVSLEFQVGEIQQTQAVRVHSAWLALFPALLAIVMALVFREVVIALLAGVLSGAFFLTGYDPLKAMLRTADHYAVGAVADPDHASILVFSLVLGGMIGVMSTSGGARGLAGLVTRRATSAAKGQLATWLLGIIIFFDDYANSLLVGSSMRPITDRLRISREKLAFLVDATAAPVSSIALVSSWIGVEVAYIGEQLDSCGIEMDAYSAFIASLPYRFYPWLMLLFGLAIVLMGRDFGPMLKAERRARVTGKVLADDAKPASNFDDELSDAAPNASLALWPIATVILVALVGMYLDGRSTLIASGETDLSLRAIYGEASSLKGLLWAACAGSIAAIASAMAAKAMTLTKALDAWVEGLKNMLLACVILVLAWALGTICKEMHTAEYVIQLIGDGLSVGLLPAIVFLIAAAVSFATGTSWGTMAILFPLVIPLAHELAPDELHILFGAISSILAGSVFGDHCSPISDTTIMSSMATSCDHVDHVRTQLPYALAVGLISVVVGEIGTGFGLYPAWVGLALGAICVLLLVRFVGKPVDVAGELATKETPTQQP